MPRTPIDYSKTIIYKLVHKDDLNDENIYVGHTTDFTKRKYSHKKACYNPNDKEYNLKKNQFIRGNGGWDAWCMIEVEKYPCNDINEATARERFWKRELNATLNSCEPNRSKKEWYQDNKEKISERDKQYQQDYRDKISEYQVRYQAKYRQDNKDKITEKSKQKVKCDICGCEVSRNNLPKHKKSKKCMTFSIKE